MEIMKRENVLNPSLNREHRLDEKKMQAKLKLDKVKEYSEKLRVHQKDQKRHKSTQPVRGTKFVKNAINADMSAILKEPKSPLKDGFTLN